MGLTNSSPNSAKITEAGEFPVDLENDFSSIKYIAGQLYYNNNIGKEIWLKKFIQKFVNLNQKFEILQQIPKIRNIKNINNLKINTEFYDYSEKSLNNISISHLYLELMTKYRDYIKIFTDGSKSIEWNGIGIIFDNSTGIGIIANKLKNVYS